MLGITTDHISADEKLQIIIYKAGNVLKRLCASYVRGVVTMPIRIRNEMVAALKRGHLYLYAAILCFRQTRGEKWIRIQP